MAFIVMIANGFFGTMSLNPYLISWASVIVAVMLLFGLFTHFAAFIGLLIYLYSVAHAGLTGMNDLSVLGGLLFLLYIKRNPFSFDHIAAKKDITVDMNPPLTVLRVFQGLALITLVCMLGYPTIFILLGIFIILGFMLRLSEFLVILIAIINILYHNVDATVAMVLLSAIALFIAGYTRHTLDYLLFRTKPQTESPSTTATPLVRTQTARALPKKKKAPKKKVVKRKKPVKRQAKKKKARR
jgi:hypothetical protein